MRLRRNHDFQIRNECPHATALALLYAELSEPADLDSILQNFPDVQPPANSETVVFSLFAKGKFIGLLRAWKDRDTKRGIIYDIAIRRGYQNQGLARALVNELLKDKETEWTGYPFRVAPNLDRDLGAIRTLYGISLVLGFQEVAKSAYTRIFGDMSQFYFQDRLLLLSLAVILTMLGLRFYWGVGNIRRFVLQRVVQLRPPKLSVLLLFHLPLLFLHAVVFFFLCRVYMDICTLPSCSGHEVGDVYSLRFVALYVSMMALNVLWLSFLKTTRQKSWPDSIWLRNNLVCGAVALGWAVYANAQSIRGDKVLYVGVAIVFINSLIDLYKTSNAYLLGDAFGGS